MRDGIPGDPFPAEPADWAVLYGLLCACSDLYEYRKAAQEQTRKEDDRLRGRAWKAFEAAMIHFDDAWGRPLGRPPKRRMEEEETEGAA